MRIEEKQGEITERLSVLETKVDDVHSWLAPRRGRPSLPERLIRVETKQAGMMRILWTLGSAVLAAAGTWVASKFGF